MLIGIASGTYSSIFIASPVLTAWKEREPGFIRRRTRIAEVEGSVPAFADEIALAQLGDDSEAEADTATTAVSEREAQPRAGAVATAEPEAGAEGPKQKSNGELDSAEAASSERRARNEERRARRQARRKHGRNR